MKNLSGQGLVRVRVLREKRHDDGPTQAPTSAKRPKANTEGSDTAKGVSMSNWISGTMLRPWAVPKQTALYGDMLFLLLLYI